jgi:hypothetical protein
MLVGQHPVSDLEAGRPEQIIRLVIEVKPPRNLLP